MYGAAGRCWWLPWWFGTEASTNIFSKPLGIVRRHVLLNLQRRRNVGIVHTERAGTPQRKNQATKGLKGQTELTAEGTAMHLGFKNNFCCTAGNVGNERRRMTNSARSISA